MLEEILGNQEQAMVDLSNLEAAVEEQTDAQESAITLIQQLADEIAANSGNQEAIDELATQLHDQASALAAAVLANTPASPDTGGGGEGGVVEEPGTEPV